MDKKLSQFDYTLVKAYSDKTVQTSVTVSYCTNRKSICHNEQFNHFWWTNCHSDNKNHSGKDV